MTEPKPLLPSDRPDDPPGDQPKDQPKDQPAPVRLVLASQSSGRLKTLRSAGVWPEILVSDVDEDAVITALPADASPADTVTALAVAKARQVASLIERSGLRAVPALDGPTAGASLRAADAADTLLVVGGDSMLFREGRLEGKPMTAAAAKARWLDMSGQTAELWSGHGLVKLVRTDGACWRAAGEASGASVATIHFGSVTEEEIDAYIGTGEPLGVAGGFTIDGLGGPFIEGVTGDPHGVVGVSLPLLRTLATDLGISWAALWAGNPESQPR